MRVDFNEKTLTFGIVDLTYEQLNHILNCIMFTKEHGGMMPPDDFKAKRKGKVI